MFLSVDFISDLIATKFLVRLNYKLVGFVTLNFSVIFFLMDTVLFKFQTFALKPEVCEMGGNFYLKNGLNLPWKLRPSGLRPKKTHVWSQLDASYDFQSMLSIFGKCDF